MRHAPNSPTQRSISCVKKFPEVGRTYAIDHRQFPRHIAQGFSGCRVNGVYYLWSLEISGAGTSVAAINLITTVLKLHAPGMTYMRMPMFCWTTLASSLMIVAAFPILTATLAMLLLDRYLGFHFFTNEGGGNVMMFIESHMGVGPSGGLYPRSASLWHLLRSRLDLLRQTFVRLPLDGRRDNGHLYTFFHGLVASIVLDSHLDPDGFQFVNRKFR